MKNLLSKSFAFDLAAAYLTGCGCYDKMAKHLDEKIAVTCSPEVVTLKGDQAITTVTVDVPAKSFDKWGILKLTPVIVYEGGEVAGKPVFFQGEKVTDNYKVVAYDTPSKLTINVSIPYNADMRSSDLYFRAEAKCLKNGSKIKEFTALPDPIHVTQGVSSTQNMANLYAKVAIAPDAFQRVTNIEEEAQIMFQINRAYVRPAELNSDEIAALEQFIIENSNDPKKTVGDVYTQAYASPDGPLKLNDKLSTERGETTHKALTAKFKKDNVPADTKFDINAMGEDWEGFKELVEASDIADKNLILQVLSMYSDPQVRDREIKNMTAAFTVLAEKILPELRRSKMSVNVEVQGLTDAEMRSIVDNGKVNDLKLEEMLFAATLYTDNAKKAAIYQAAANKFNDYRAWNNLGVVAAWEGEFGAAADMFKKAASLNNTNPQVINNLGVVALSQGKNDEAAKYFAASTAPEAKYNKGLVELVKGNYASAIPVLTGYNKGLAQLLNGDLAGAKSTLANEKCWASDYLKAIIAAKEGNNSNVYKNLESAVEKGGNEVAELAETDVNFYEFFAEEAFQSIVK